MTKEALQSIIHFTITRNADRETAACNPKLSVKGWQNLFKTGVIRRTPVFKNLLDWFTILSTSRRTIAKECIGDM